MNITRRHMLASGAAGIAALGAPVRARATPAPFRVATLKFGTVNWELETIRREGFDTANGVALEVLGMAGSSAAKIAFEGGAADCLVSDWLWVARQRASGRDFVFSQYSRAVGGLIVPEDSAAQTLADLRGKKIGVAGGPLDKSWLILQTLATQQGFDLAGETEPVFAAPPLIMQQAKAGKLDAVLNYWHYEARMRAAGFRTLIGVQDAAAELGLPRDLPLLGYVFRESFATENPHAVSGFLAASRQAKALLAESDDAWEKLRPMMKAANDAEFLALRNAFRAGIPDGTVNAGDAAAMFALMRRLGGAALVGDAESLPDGVFYDGA